MIKCDYLIIGAGIIGVNISRELSVRYPNKIIVVIDKEKEEGLHASGRNSGVLHAGFYYTNNSLKAKFTRDGNADMTSYCEENNLPINKCGKLVVAQSNKELQVLDELLHRAKTNGVSLEKITEEEARKIEPRVKTIKYALFSPTTSTVDPKLIINSMVKNAIKNGVIFKFNTSYLGNEDCCITTSKGIIRANYIINSAGLYADKIAKDFGFSKDYYLLPFKGLYLKANYSNSPLSTNVYPVPKLENPFLGVHYTVTVDGDVKVGPTAIPALWREQYKGLDNFNSAEFFKILSQQLNLAITSKFDFKKIALEEVLKYYKPNMIKKAVDLCSGFDKKSFDDWSTPGIRAQLVNAREKKLEMDFVVEGDSKSIHILNAVSPAFTCSIPFSKYIVDCIDNLINTRSLHKV
jgi:(S)-2-hydroxyglutarate dehydrogenase